MASSASAADSVYWDSGTGSGAIRVGSLSGGAGTDLFSGENIADGVAIDAAAGKIYWANQGSGKIRVGSLNGGTATDLFSGESNPTGVAIDPAAGKIYWADEVSGKIRVGSLSGGTATDLFSGENNPNGVAIDPAAGKIYWANGGNLTIRVGSLSGGTATNLFVGENNPIGVAIDPAGGKIYWADASSGTIRVGSLSGGTASDLFSGESTPVGVAIDHAAGKIYWGTNVVSGKVRVGSLSGGTASDLFSGEVQPRFPALLRAPSPSGAPVISGGSGIIPLSCSPGSWAPDLLGSFLYRVPQSFAYTWSRNGTPIAGATSSALKPTKGGSFACQVTAQNAAGSSSQTSTVAARCVVPNLKRKTLKRARKTARRGDCKLKVKGKKGNRVRIKKQKQRPGRILPAGTKVKVTT